MNYLVINGLLIIHVYPYIQFSNNDSSFSFKLTVEKKYQRCKMYSSILYLLKSTEI